MGAGTEELTVLVVDDDPLVCETIQICLDGEYFVHTAFSIEMAAKLIEQYSIDLVFLDLNVHGLDGKDFLTELRGNGFKEPIIIISADHNRSAEMFIAGASTTIIKPLEVEDILEIADRAIKDAAKRRAKYVQGETCSGHIETLHSSSAKKLNRAGKLLQLLDRMAGHRTVDKVLSNPQAGATLREVIKIVNQTESGLTLAHKAVIGASLAITVLTGVWGWSMNQDNLKLQLAMSKSRTQSGNAVQVESADPWAKE